MNAYEYAMKMELEAEKLYRDMAESTNDIHVKRALLLLAEEEVKHYKAFEKMAQNTSTSVHAFDIEKISRELFSEIKAEKKRYNFSVDQVAYYRKAAKIEDSAYKFYIQKANEMEDEEQKRAFLHIAAEEKKHHELMENLAAFVASPDVWLESAEFYRIVEED